MEKHLLVLEASAGGGSDANGESLEDKALELAIEEIYQKNGQKWKPWANNARSLRVGDLILIVDSDTIVPEVLIRIERFTARNAHAIFTLQDCFRDAARELAECPEVAIIQHESGEPILVRNVIFLLTFLAFRCHAGCPPLL